MSGRTPTVGEGDIVTSTALSVLAASMLIIVLRAGQRREPIRTGRPRLVSHCAMACHTFACA